MSLVGSQATLFDRARCSKCDKIFAISEECERHLCHPRDLCCNCFAASVVLKDGEDIPQGLAEADVKELLKASSIKRQELKTRLAATLTLYNEARAAFLAEDERSHKLAIMLPVEKLPFHDPSGMFKRRVKKARTGKTFDLAEAKAKLALRGIDLDDATLTKLLEG